MNTREKIMKAIQDNGYNNVQLANALGLRHQALHAYLRSKNPDKLTLRFLILMDLAGLVSLQDSLPELLESEKQKIQKSLPHDPKVYLENWQQTQREQQASKFELNETEQEAYRLHSEGKSFREIAKILGCNYQTAMNNVNRAGWKKLKQLEAQKE